MIGGAVCLLAAAPARAGVVVQVGVPFTAAQLEAAIAARGGAGDGGLEVEVSRPSPERLALVMPAGRWEIEIGAASGETAARVVALHVIELAAGAAAAAAAAPAAVSAAPATPTAGAAPAPAAAAVQAAEVRAPAPPRAGHRYRLAALGVGSRGVRAGDFTSVGGASADVVKQRVLRARRELLAMLERAERAGRSTR